MKKYLKGGRNPIGPISLAQWLLKLANFSFAKLRLTFMPSFLHFLLLLPLHSSAPMLTLEHVGHGASWVLLQLCWAGLEPRNFQRIFSVP